MTLNVHIFKVKLMFTATVAAMIGLVVVGSFLLKPQPVTQSSTLEAVNMSLLNSQYAKFAVLPRVEGASTLAAVTGFAQSVPVLNYHGIVKDTDWINFSQEDFKNQLYALKQDGWQTISAEDFTAFVQGTKQLPPKSFLLTFDDARKDSFYGADPVLKALDYRAVMYVITGQSLVEKPSPYYLNKTELHYMQDSGRWELQPHAKDGHGYIAINNQDRKGNFYSNKKWLPEQQRVETDEEFASRVKGDLAAAKEDMEREFGTKALTYAFPFGDLGENSLNYPGATAVVGEITRELFPVAFYQVKFSDQGTQNYPAPDAHLFRRYSMQAGITPEDLVKQLNAIAEKPVVYTEDFSNPFSWKKTWGMYSVASSTMSLWAPATSTGASVYLDGSKNWNSYTFTAAATASDTDSFSLLARYRDDQNYIACTFLTGWVTATETVNGQTTEIYSLKMPLRYLPDKTYSFGIGVSDREVSCLIDNATLLTTTKYDNAIPAGGVGIKIWKQQEGAAKTNITFIHVKPKP